MVTTRRSVLALAAAAAPGPALAQAAFPSRPVRVVLGAAAGSAPDTAMRLMADRFAAVWGQPVVVENRPGAGGNLGAAAMARAEPDGHVLLLAQASTFVLNQHLLRTMPFDPARDFAPVTMLLHTPFVLVARPGLGVADLPGLVARARRTEGGLTFGTSGATSLPRLAGEALARAAGISLVNVPYGGSPAALSDVLAGRTDLMVDGTPLLTPPARAGTVVPLAVTSAARFPPLPGVPTLAEAYPVLVFGGWFALMAPAATPTPTIARIAADAVTVLAEPGLRTRLLNDFGAVADAAGPASLAAHAAEERERLGRLVREIGMQPE